MSWEAYQTFETFVIEISLWKMFKNLELVKNAVAHLFRRWDTGGSTVLLSWATTVWTQIRSYVLFIEAL